MMINIEVIRGILIPFFGTTLGALCVLMLRGELNRGVQRVMAGFAAGVMVAASLWSLLIPAIEQSEALPVVRFFPAAAGFAVGYFFLLLLDRLIPQPQNGDLLRNGSNLKKTYMTVLAVTLHNLPEGMAVGVVFAARLAQDCLISESAALALAVGIAVQNFPEGAIVSLPLHSAGVGKGKSLFFGILSGAVELVGAAVTVLAAVLVAPALPYFLSFAAGAMIYVVVEELIPEMADGAHTKKGAVSFAFGFLLMMILDVALG